MGTRGYFLSVHHDAEQGNPSTQATGESTQAGEETNRHGGRMAKAMKKDSEGNIRREIQIEESKRPRETLNSEP